MTDAPALREQLDVALMVDASAPAGEPDATAATDQGVVEPLPAATVVLLRPGPDGLEALLTHRPTTMAFAADMHVFPAAVSTSMTVTLRSRAGLCGG